MTQPGRIDVSDLDLKVENTAGFTRLRVPSKLSAIQWLGLALLLGTPLFVWTVMALGVLFGATETAPALIAASVVVIVLAAVGVLLARRIRAGPTVTVTRDRLVVKKPWAHQQPFESLVTEIRFQDAPNGILVFGGGQKVTIGSALLPTRRSALINFLNGVIDDRLRAAPASAPGWPARKSIVDPSGDEVAREPIVSDGELAADPDPIEIRLLALCRALKANDTRNLVHVAPNIPERVLASALESYLGIQPDEVLLAIAGVPKQGTGIVGCAVTSKRIYWPGKRLKSAGTGPPRSWSLEHASLPGIVRRKSGTAALELGESRRILCSGGGLLSDRLIDLLAGARAMACGDVAPPEIAEHDRGNARVAWPRVVAANTAARALEVEIRKYVSRTQIASRAVVTQLIALACFAVFAAMCALGVPVFMPTSQQLVAWGANFGQYVVIDHQYWRLFTAMFLHIGLFHILLNMLCLITAGPVVERFLGHFGFAALYVLSGIGGSIASIWAHPTTVSAGASGAIFGIMGGLIGFLVIRHRDVPRAVLKPMRVGAIGFVGYNTMFSLSIPQIDMAAHLGGLATGFVCGLLMTLVSAPLAYDARRPVPALRRALVAIMVAVALAGLGWKTFELARSKFVADRVNYIAGRLHALPNDPSAKP